MRSWGPRDSRPRTNNARGGTASRLARKDGSQVRGGLHPTKESKGQETLDNSSTKSSKERAGGQPVVKMSFPPQQLYTSSRGAIMGARGRKRGFQKGKANSLGGAMCWGTAKVGARGRHRSAVHRPGKASEHVPPVFNWPQSKNKGPLKKKALESSNCGRMEKRSNMVGLES